MDPFSSEPEGPSRSKKPRWAPRRILEPLDWLPARRLGGGQADGAWLQAFADRVGRQVATVCEPETGEPGPYLRWLCVLRLICERLRVEPTNEEGSPWNPPGPRSADAEPNGTQIDAALQQALGRSAAHMQSAEAPREWLRFPFHHGTVANLWRDAEHFLNEAQPIYCAIDQCLREIRARDGLPTLTLRQVLKEPLLRPGEPLCGDVIERLAGWLEGDAAPAMDDLSRLRADIFVVGTRRSPRVALLKRVRAHLLQPSTCGEDDHAPLMNIWSTGGFVGLRALTTYACLGVKRRSRRMPRGARPSMIYVPLNRIRTDQDNRRTTRQDVLDILCRWLDLRVTPAAEGTAAHQAHRIQALQRELTRRRLIVIFDGIEISSPPFGAVNDLIRATDWPNFIRALIQPDDTELQRNGGRYMSRFLLLSNRRIDSLAAWMATGQAPALDPVQSRAEALDLLLNRGRMAHLHEELEQQCQTLWPSPYARPDVRPDERSLHQLYALSEATAQALVDEAGGLPDESDMALATCADAAGCRWGTDGRVRPWDQIQRQQWRKMLLHAWLHEPDKRRHPKDWDVPAATVVLQFIALSFNGMRLETLDRALARFAARSKEAGLGDAATAMRNKLAKPGSPAQFKEHYKVFVDQYVDTDLEAVPHQLRWFELQTDPRGDNHLQFLGAREIFEIRDEASRELLLADMLAGGAQLERFRLMNEILSEEALTQATAQVRRSASGTLESALALRRFLQSIVHGLYSLDMAKLDPSGQPSHGNPALVSSDSSLPEDSYRRYVLLYELLYRRCIENAPAWAFTRGQVREDVRSALLAIFVNPGWARHVLSELHSRGPDDRSMATFGAFGAPSHRGFRNAFDVAQPHLRGALGIDLFNALVHSALRSGEHLEYAHSAERIAAELASANASEERSLQALHARRAEWGFDFTKVAIDALQASGAPHDEVIARCQEALSRLGAHLPWPGILNLGEAFAGVGWKKAEFEKKVLRPVASDCCPSGRSQKELERIGDILFRLGEVLATRADWGDGGNEFDVSMTRYCNAYAVFWIGDRVRAQAATRDLASVAWPAVSSRAMRYYIRVTLKVAKLAARRAGSTEPSHRLDDANIAREFFAHARARVDVYARHLFRLPAERIQILLLLAAAARVRASIAQRLHVQLGERELVQRSLDASVDYLEDTRQLMLSMEFPAAALRRYLLERIKTHSKLSALGELPTERRQAHVALAQRDMAILTRLSASSKFWRDLLARLRVPAL